MKSISVFICLAFAFAEIAAAQNTITPTNHIELFKVIVDTRSGQYVVVNADNTTVSLKDKNGNVIWPMALAKQSKLSTARVFRSEKIRSMIPDGNSLQ
jgi:hypothetical protein